MSNDSGRVMVAAGGADDRGPKRGRRNPFEIVRDSGLPEPLRILVLAVTGKARLNAAERADVARELCAHFRDGLESGASAEELRASFGDAGAAARLIGRAKRRQRGPAYRAMRRLAQGVGVLAVCLVVVYAYLAVRFFAASPEISVDYLARLNEPTRSVPEEDRAWPGIRAAILAMPKDVVRSTHQNPEDRIGNWPYPAKGTQEWTEGEAFVESVRPAIELYVSATRKSVFGRVLERMSEFDAELAAHLNIDTRKGVGDAPESMLIGVLVPELAQVRRFGRLLAFDARAGAAAGDGARTVRALRGLFDTARLSRQQPFLISDLVGQAVLAMGVTTLAETLALHPESLSDAQLTEVAHALATAASTTGSLEGAPLTPQLAGERMFFLDAVQHVYSDDGRGDGRLTAEGMKHLNMMAAFAGTGSRELSPLDLTAGPVFAAAAPGRMRAVQDYEQMMVWTHDKAAKPMWLWTDADSLDLKVEMRKRSSVAGAMDVGTLLMPALDKYVHTCNLSAMQREAGLTMIAIELHRRRTGALPRSLRELDRTLLPLRPIDRYTGGLLGYRLDASVASGYRLYSVGPDYADNGGTLYRDVEAPTGWRSRAWAERVRRENPNVAPGTPASVAGGEAAFIGLDLVYMPPRHLLPAGSPPSADRADSSPGD